MIKFNSLPKFYFAVFAAACVPLAAMAAGVVTNGVPPIVPGATGTYFPSDGVCKSTGNNNCLSQNFYVNELGGFKLLPADTQLGSGAQPQSVAPTAFQIAAISAGIAGNTATASSGAATLATLMGYITTESLSTAAGSSYTLTITDTAAAATMACQFAVYSGTNKAGVLQPVSCTPASGSVVIVVKNVGSAALNGTLQIPFQLQ